MELICLPLIVLDVIINAWLVVLFHNANLVRLVNIYLWELAFLALKIVKDVQTSVVFNVIRDLFYYPMENAQVVQSVVLNAIPKI